MADEILNTEGASEEEYNPIIVSVVDEDGTEHTFEEIDSLELDDNEYVALIPIYDDDVQEDEGELIILRRSYQDEDVYLEPIEDEATFMKIGEMFEERLSDIFDFEEE